MFIVPMFIVATLDDVIAGCREPEANVGLSASPSLPYDRNLLDSSFLNQYVECHADLVCI